MSIDAKMYSKKPTEFFFSGSGWPTTDEIAEPRPDMNIKVAAFTVSEKYINMPLPFGMGQFLKDKKSIFPCYLYETVTVISR